MRLQITLLLVFFSFIADAQKKDPFKDPATKATFEKAEYYYEAGNYKAALTEYKKLEKDYADDQLIIFRIAVCEQFQSDGIERSLSYFEKCDRGFFLEDHFEFYYGRALHLNCKFDEAITELKNYNGAKYADKKKKPQAEKIMKYCENGKPLVANPIEVKIEGIGQPINSENSEYAPVISSDNSFMAFTYRGPNSTGENEFFDPDRDFNEDVFFSEKDSLGNWSVPKKVAGNVNTKDNDASVAISGDGQRMIMFRSVEGDPGSIFECKLNGAEWSEPRKLYGEINSPWWEGGSSFSADGKTVYFSSERPGGKGGKDIYKSKLQSDGSWGEIQNMTSINTPDDENAPFIHPSGQFILFSSNGYNTMGGFDIFKTELKDDTAWSTPENIGYPVNTPGDDIFYVISADGKIGYYSSGKAGGYGRQDIYTVSPGNFGKIKMVLVKGVITLNDKPVQSDIVVSYSKTANNFGDFNSNSVSGKYLVNLPSGKDFNITYKLDGFVPQVRNITTTSVEDYFETTIDIQFYTNEYLAMLNSKKDSLKPVVTTTTIIDAADLINRFGDFKDPDLRFKVQIAAYNMPQNFNYSSVLKLGKVEKQKLDDQITRFTMGSNMTLRDAYVYRDQIIAAGITDAFVTAVYKGKRYLIKELVDMGVFK